MVPSLEKIFTQWGLSSSLSHLLSILAVVLAIIFLSVIADWITKRIILRGLRKLALKTKYKWDDALVEQGVFHRLSHLAPALVIYFAAAIPFPDSELVTTMIRRLAMGYMVLVGGFTFDSLLSAIGDIYRHLEVTKGKPIKTYIQVAKIILYLLVGIIFLGTLMNKSPWAFLSGLGAMTAIILLVFRDSILGFVASVQLSSQNMVRIGDWIEVPKYGADGDVIDISLTTIKVQNWDKTISTIPTYALIGDSFKNWRGMSESGGRRIKRSLNIDLNSIGFLSDEQIQNLRSIKYLKAYLEGKQSEIQKYNEALGIQPQEKVNGRRLTNIGTFRAYVKEYLKHHPQIHQDKMTFLVRHLQPNEKGLPLEIYVFSKDQNWVRYEEIQADLFDHFFAVLPEFGLRAFQNPTGLDFRNILDQSRMQSSS